MVLAASCPARTTDKKGKQRQREDACPGFHAGTLSFHRYSTSTIPSRQRRPATRRRSPSSPADISIFTHETGRPALVLAVFRARGRRRRPRSRPRRPRRRPAKRTSRPERTWSVVRRRPSWRTSTRPSKTGRPFELRPRRRGREIRSASRSGRVAASGLTPMSPVAIAPMTANGTSGYSRRFLAGSVRARISA